MAEDLERIWQAQLACERRLSGIPLLTPRQRIDALIGGDFDLDARPDFYGDGPVRRLEERVAELLGKEDAAFFPSGTMAQQVALRIWAARAGNNAVAMHPMQHLAAHERDAFTALSGLRPVWLTHDPRQPTLQEVTRLDERFGTLMLELPLRDTGFLLPTFDELTAMVAVARARGAFVHFDGARLWESTAHLGQDLPTIAALADSVYVSFYKTLQGLSGAALIGSSEFVAEARAWKHRYGGNAFQQWPAVMTAMLGLDTILPRLGTYVAQAREVAAVLGKLPGARIHPDPPHTHQFQLWLPYPAEVLNEAGLTLAERDKVWLVYGWRDRPPTGLAMAEITVAEPAVALTPAELAEIADAFHSLIQGVG
ncbi:MAG TPA: beta-eliminating lyase-related protein [Candidatus Limnocylindrales bacterium]|nr:beta-eliminating lyase-related protein [Candidatus Limnocylindrales bacterium]